MAEKTGQGENRCTDGRAEPKEGYRDDGERIAVRGSNLGFTEESRTYQRELETQNQELLRMQAELLDARNRFAELFDGAPMGYLTLNARGRILEANRTVAHMLGEIKKRLVGQPLHRFLRSADREQFAMHLREVLLGNGQSVRELRLRSRHRPEMPVQIVSSPCVRDPERMEVEIRCCVFDLTAREQAEKEKMILQKRLDDVRRTESLAVLAGGIAHDFNNLLMGVLGNAELIREDLPPGSPTKRRVEDIRVAALRLAETTRQLLAYSGKGTFVEQAVDLSTCVSDMAGRLAEMRRENISLELDLAQDLPPVRGDWNQIRQIVENLVANATEAVGEARGSVVIRTRTVTSQMEQEPHRYGLSESPSTGERVVLEVSDTGCGMATGMLGRIFEPFFTTRAAAQGLGLAAVRGIVNAMGGGVEVFSREAEGTTMRVTFPCRHTAEEDVAAEGAGQAGPLRAAGSTVLVIDDEPTVRTVTRRMLERGGFGVLTAENGVEGVRTLREHAGEILVVVLDMTMPGMNGVETFHALRQSCPDLPVLFSSGYTEQETMTRFSGSRPDAFIQKPYEGATLVTQVNRLLGVSESPS